MATPKEMIMLLINNVGNTNVAPVKIITLQKIIKLI